MKFVPHTEDSLYSKYWGFSILIYLFYFYLVINSFIYVSIYLFINPCFRELKSAPHWGFRHTHLAVMASGGREQIQDLLEKLHHGVSGNDIRSSRHAKDIIVDISVHLSKDLSPVQYGELFYFIEHYCLRVAVGSVHILYILCCYP